MSSEQYLEAARAASAIIEEEAEKSEKQVKLTDRAAQALTESGIFWMCVPKELGGGGVDIVTAIEVLEEITRADGSAGWVAMAVSMQNRSVAETVSGMKPVFAESEPKPLAAGTSAPSGKAIAVEGGFRVERAVSQFGSGANFATHFVLSLAVVEEDSQPRLGSDGAQELRICVVPREAVTILGNWDVMGLVGTGSYDFEVVDQFIPEHMTVMRTSSATSTITNVIGDGLNLASFGAAGHAAVPLGLMKRALSEVAEIVEGKRRAGYTTTVDESPVFLAQFTKHEALYLAARAVVLDVFGKAEMEAALNGKTQAATIARMRTVTTWAHEVAAEVISFAHLWGSSRALRNPSALGRTTRDIAAAKVHVYVDPNTMVTAGPAILESWRNG